jgi:hypothetical protein
MAKPPASMGTGARDARGGRGALGERRPAKRTAAPDAHARAGVASVVALRAEGAG